MENFQERTEEPTAKRLKEAKEQGDTPFSEDLFKSTFLIIALFSLWLFSSSLGNSFLELFKQSFSHLNRENPEGGLKTALLPFLWPVTALMLIFFFSSFLITIVQRGFFIAFKKKKSSHKGKLIPALFFLVKGSLLLIVTALFLRFAKWNFATLFHFAIALTLLLFCLGCCDYFYQRISWKNRMKMTKQEVKDEQKESEGNR